MSTYISYKVIKLLIVCVTAFIAGLLGWLR